jgi:IS5 family transposase
MKSGKKLADGVRRMYKKQSKQVCVTDFMMPLGLQLDPENRWVKEAATIPWDEIEQRYAALFESETGNVAKPLRLALGAVLIQTQYPSFSDAEVPQQIRENPYMQYFCGLPGYVDELPFDSSSMVHFRKRLTPEILGEINEMIIAKAEGKDGPPDDPGDVDDDEPENEGDLLVDATCAPQNIRYPLDLSLLNEARENLEGMIDELHDPADGEKPRTYRRIARKEYLNVARKKRKTPKEIRRAIRKQLGYIKRDWGVIVNYLAAGKSLSDKHLQRLETIELLYEQQLFMYENRVNRVDNRIVSLSQYWVRPIVRGKAKAKTEFGAKLDISVTNGFTRLEHSSFDAYNEGENLIEIVERFRKREGHYPKRVLADKIYRTKENLKYCAKHKIRLLGKPLGRPKKVAVAEKKQTRADEIDRIEVERKFSHAKGSFGLGLIRARLKATSQTTIALSILALNIAHAGRILRALFRWWFAVRKFVVIQ